MTAGSADGATINVNSSFHTLQLPSVHGYTESKWRLVFGILGTRDFKGEPEFLDEFRETGKQVCAVLVQFLDIFFVFIRGIDDGDFWQVIHWRSMWFIRLTL